MPDPGSSPGQARSGILAALTRILSGVAWIAGQARNDIPYWISVVWRSYSLRFIDT